MGETISRILTNSTGVLALGCFVGSLSSTTWTTSDLVSTGLYQRCVNYPGVEDCTPITGVSTLSSIRYGIVGATACNVLAIVMSLSARCQTICRFLAAGAHFISGVTGLSKASSFKNTFQLCSDSTLGVGYTLAIVGGVLSIATSIFSVCYACTGSESESSENVKVSSARIKNRKTKSRRSKRRTVRH